jgi:hypothetical protein
LQQPDLRRCCLVPIVLEDSAVFLFPKLTAIVNKE